MQKDQAGVRSHLQIGDHSREQDLSDREAAVEAREEAVAKRGDREQDLLADADKRDDEANARDAAANRRDMTASLSEFLEDPIDTQTLRARGAAALDRSDARHDRSAAKTDRAKLTDDGPAAPSK